MRRAASARSNAWRLPCAPLLLLVTLCAGSSCARAPRSEGWWRSDAAHPLVGRIWSAAVGRAIDEALLIERLAAHRFVLLGERHDSADHHLLQARVLRALVTRGRRPAVAFEMLSVDVAPALEAARARSPADPGALRAAVRWDESGWPEWSLYAPVFEAVLRAHLPVVAASLARGSVEAIQRQGISGLESALVAQLALEQPLPAAQRLALAQQIREAHCGYAPEDAIGRMVEVQWARDAQLARSLLGASARVPGDGAVLIAGVAHVRADRGVPYHLARFSPAASIASLAFLEVSGVTTDPARELADRYAEGAPFDYVWFTPRVGDGDGDPCERYERQLERMRRG